MAEMFYVILKYSKKTFGQNIFSLRPNPVVGGLALFTCYGGRSRGRHFFIFIRSVLRGFHHQLPSLQIALDAGVVDTNGEDYNQSKDNQDDS